MFVSDYNDEFAFSLFQGTGEEIALPRLDALTGSRIEDYQDTDMTKEYRISFADSEESYILLLARNTDKESQIVLALRGTLPILSVIVILMSVITAFFYTWYMTKPIKKISRLSKQMADMEFGGLCPVNRTDEVRVLSHSLNDLSKKLAAALSELQEANQKLQADSDRERQLVEFFASASHELKTPIASITASADIAAMEHEGDEWIANIRKQTLRLGRLVNDLVALSRLDEETPFPEKNDFSLSETAWEAAEPFGALAGARGKRFSQHIEEGLMLHGDRDSLRRLISILLDNAVRHSDEGGEIRMDIYRRRGRAYIEVENSCNLPQIPDLNRLFDRFYRVDESRSARTGGTGIGLSMAQAITQAHGGRIEARQPDGKHILLRAVLPLL